jgi:hypothetical protein
MRLAPQASTEQAPLSKAQLALQASMGSADCVPCGGLAPPPPPGGAVIDHAWGRPAVDPLPPTPAAGNPSPGRYRHPDAAQYISFVILHIKHTERRLNDFGVYA